MLDGQIIVMVFVDEPKDDICEAESICTGVFYGFKDEDEALQWVDNINAEWNKRPNVRYVIDKLSHKSVMI
jgi:hypothetical protein